MRTTRIIAHTLEEKPKEPEIDLQIREANKQDFDYFESSDEYSKRDIRMLRTADICIVVRDSNRVVHHNALSLESFPHPTSPLSISLEEEEAYSLNIWTAESHRGQGIYQNAHVWGARYVYDLGIRRIYSQVDEQNNPSIKATQKVGYKKVGERHSITTGEFETHIITGDNIYANTTTLTTSIGNIEIAKTRDNRFSRIEQELEEYIEQWDEDGDSIVLFGSGNHAQELLDRTDLSSLVDYAVDEDSEKVGSNVPNSDVPVYSVNKFSEKSPNIIVICSEAFQNDMATRARERLETAEIVVLYPHVSRFDEMD